METFNSGRFVMENAAYVIRSLAMSKIMTSLIHFLAYKVKWGNIDTFLKNSLPI